MAQVVPRVGTAVEDASVGPPAGITGTDAPPPGAWNESGGSEVQDRLRPGAPLLERALGLVEDLLPVVTSRQHT